MGVVLPGVTEKATLDAAMVGAVEGDEDNLAANVYLCISTIIH